MSRGRSAPPATATEVNRRLKRGMALDLRVKGYSQAEIAQQLGVAQPTVSRWIKTMLSERQDMSVEVYRKLEDARIEALERTMWQALGRGNLQAAMVLTRLLDRRAKLYGLDTPVAAAASKPQIVISIPEDLHAAIMGVSTAPSGLVMPELAAGLAAEQHRHINKHSEAPALMTGEQMVGKTGDDDDDSE